MKANLLKVSFMAFAAMLAAGCSQEHGWSEVETPEQGQPQILSVSATSQSFTTDDAQTRVAENGEETTFENGDRMGLFIIENPDTESARILLKNIPLTYDGTNWAGAQNIYYYKNADYIAYFPYNAGISPATPAEVKSSIKGYFDANGFRSAKGDQSRAETYRAADLMMSTISASVLAAQTGETKALNFNLEHQYSLIELALPVHNFYYTGAQGVEKDFSVSMIEFVLRMKEGTDASEAVVKPYDMGKGIYRYLVTPGAFTLSGEFKDPKDFRPVEFNSSASTQTLEAGKYIRFNVSFAGHNSSRQAREIIGDYYYRDENSGNGLIWPKEFLLPTDVTKKCVGIIFDRVGAELGSNAAGWSHYVMGLSQRSTPTGVAAFANTDFVSGSFATFATAQDAFADLSGYAATQAMKEGVTDFAVDRSAIDQMNQYATRVVAAPVNTSGWFIPAIGQFYAFYNNIGKPSVPITATNAVSNTNAEPTAVQTITDAIQRIDATYAKFDSGVYISSSFKDATNFYLIDAGGTKMSIITKANTEANRRVRPALAF